MKGIVDSIHDQIENDLSDTAGGRSYRFTAGLKGQAGREEEGIGHPYDGRKECTGHVKDDDGLHACALRTPLLGDGMDDQEEDEHRRYALQRFHKEIAEDFQERDGRRHEGSHEDAENQSEGNLMDQLDFGNERKKFKNQKYLLWRNGDELFTENVTLQII